MNFCDFRNTGMTNINVNQLQICHCHKSELLACWSADCEKQGEIVGNLRVPTFIILIKAPQ